jgi:hypothetical protein
MTPFLGKERPGVVVSLLQQVAHRDKLQPRKLLKAREVPIAGDQRYVVIEATLGNQGVRDLGAIAMAD